MKTQQAVSPRAGREAAPLHPRAAPVVWLNLMCLDAPLVAVSWLWLFGRAFRIPLQTGNVIALFLTAWLIYLADRLADTISLSSPGERSLRQRFTRRHREVWVIAIALVAGFDGYVIWRAIAAETFMVGLAVGIVTVVYLALNHPVGSVWRRLPAKEVAIGCLFAAGTVVALSPGGGVTVRLTLGGVAFAILCALNCVSIAVWERELDCAQGKVSIATRHPGVVRHVGKVCLGLAAASFLLALTSRPAPPVFLCVGVSALLLGWLNGSWSRSLGMDQRTALADLVLLTPVMVMVGQAFL